MASKKDELKSALTDYADYTYNAFDVLWNRAIKRIQRVINNEYFQKRQFTTINAGDKPREYIIELPGDFDALVDIWIVDANDVRIEQIQEFIVERSKIAGSDKQIYFPKGIPNDTRIEVVYKRMVNDNDSDVFYDLFLTALLVEASAHNRDVEMIGLYQQDFNDSINNLNSEYYMPDTFTDPTFD